MSVDLIGTTGAKHDWIDKGVSEAHVHQPRLFQVNSQQHVIELRAKAAIVAAHPGREHLHIEAQCGEQFAK